MNDEIVKNNSFLQFYVSNITFFVTYITTVIEKLIKMENLSIPTLRIAYKHYVNWVSNHPERTTDLEASIKWISYFLAGILFINHYRKESLLTILVYLKSLQVESITQHYSLNLYIQCPTS